MYGPGEDSLTLTVEHGAVYDRNASREERGEAAHSIYFYAFIMCKLCLSCSFLQTRWSVR